MSHTDARYRFEEISPRMRDFFFSNVETQVNLVLIDFQIREEMGLKLIITLLIPVILQRFVSVDYNTHTL